MGNTYPDGNDFTLVPTGKVQGSMWEDKHHSLMDPYALVNLDGLTDEDEPALADVAVALYRVEDDELVASTTTGLLGGYEFAGLPPDDYYVEFGKPGPDPTRWRYTLKNVGQGSSSDDPEKDSEADREADPYPGRSDPFTLDMGEELEDIDAGLYRIASISGVVWRDDYDNSVFDFGVDSTGFGGLEVRLYDGDGTLLETKYTSTSPTPDLDGFGPGGGSFFFDRLEVFEPDGSQCEYYLWIGLPADRYSTDGYYEVWDRYAFVAPNVDFPIYDSEPYPNHLTDRFDFVDSDERDGYLWVGVKHWQEWSMVGYSGMVAAPDFDTYTFEPIQIIHGVEV